MNGAIARSAGLAAILAIAQAAVVFAQQPSATNSSPAVSSSSGIFLAPGVADILKLSHAKVGDSVILAYIENSGTIYNLDAGQIVYLRDAGVSEAVIQAMLRQKSAAVDLAAQQAAQAQSGPPAPGGEAAPAVPPAYDGSPQQAPPGSSVYVIPYNPIWPDYGYAGGYWPGYGYYSPYWYGFGTFYSRGPGFHGVFGGGRFHGSFGGGHFGGGYSSGHGRR